MKSPPLFTPRDVPNGERRLYADPRRLLADPRNARIHPPRQVAALANSLLRFGQQKPIVVDASGKVLAGHGILEALRHEKESAVAWVVVSTLDELHARAYAVTDNRTGELSLWDDALLADALAELAKADADLLHATAFDERELAELLANVDELAAEASRAIAPSSNGLSTKAAARAEPDPAKPARSSWEMQDRPPMLGTGPAIARRGDVWTIGPHRLACGDSRDRKLVARVLQGATDFVLVTDPPYCSGSSQEAGKAAGTFGDIAADNLSLAGFRELVREALAACGAQTVYVFTDWRQWPNLLAIVEGSGLAGRAMLVWNKGAPGIGHAWRPTHELILFASRKAAVRAKGAVGLGNVLNVARARNLYHWSEKPVALLERILEGDEVMSRPGVLVFDPFAGSCSSLIAAHKRGRAGVGIEVEPLCVDAALRRMRDELKLEPELVFDEGHEYEVDVHGAGFDHIARRRLGRDDQAPTKEAGSKANRKARAALTASRKKKKTAK